MVPKLFSVAASVSVGVFCVLTSLTTAPVYAQASCVNDSYFVQENNVLNGGSVLANDSSSMGFALQAAVVSGPTYGTLSGSFTPSGYFAYSAPSVSATTNDTFVYRVSDGNGVMVNCTVTITIWNNNSAPIAQSNKYILPEDSMVGGNIITDNTGTGVDMDFDGDPLTVAKVNGSSANVGVPMQTNGGSITVNPNGSFSYFPHPNYNGSDVFSYQITDGTALSNTTTVTLQMNSVNDVPIAIDDNYALSEDTTLVTFGGDGLLVNDMDIDGGTLTVVAVNGSNLNVGAPFQTNGGSVTVNSDGSFSYSPSANYNGTDSFMYTVSDGQAADNAWVYLTVTAVNDAPVAVNNSYSTPANTPVSGNVVTNDTDVDGDVLTVVTVNGNPSGVGAPVALSNSTVTLNSNGSFTFVPSGSYVGLQSFTYEVTDGNGLTSTATVTVNIVAPPRRPIGGSKPPICPNVCNPVGVN